MCHLDTKRNTPISKQNLCTSRVVNIIASIFFNSHDRVYGRYGTYNFCVRRLSRSNDLPKKGNPSILNLFSREFLSTHVAFCRVLSVIQKRHD